MYNRVILNLVQLYVYGRTFKRKGGGKKGYSIITVANLHKVLKYVLAR